MGNSESAGDERGEQGETPRQYFKMFKEGKEMLVNSIIRPPRAEYEMEELGPNQFMFGGKIFERTDFTLKNPRGLTLQCSWWQPIGDHRTQDQLPCVIYMHGNASCRVEAVTVLSSVLAIGATVLSFDFAGSGHSEGEFISLGYFERDDLQSVIEHLRQSGTVSTVGLWGRSMGAATALLHGDRDPSIAGMILDSPFADLTQLAKELVEHARREGHTIPSFVVSIALNYIGSQVKSQADFDIKKVCPEGNVHQCFIPALFAHASGDDFILPHHSRQIFEKYAGDKNLISVEGDHGSDRPAFFFSSAAIFLQNALHVPHTLSLDTSQHSSSPNPPWSLVPYRSILYSPQDVDAEMLRQAMAISLQDNKGQTPQKADEEKIEPDEVGCAKLKEMGFDEASVRSALVLAGNNVDVALGILLG